MAKTLTFTFEGNDYTLEFTRETTQQLERQGFNSDELMQKSQLRIPELFAGAFLAHHRYLRRNEIDRIYKAMPNKPELLTRLIEMYREPYETLLADPEPGEGNVTWTANF